MNNCDEKRRKICKQIPFVISNFATTDGSQGNFVPFCPYIYIDFDFSIKCRKKIKLNNKKIKFLSNQNEQK